MAYQLRCDEVLDALRRMEHDQADLFTRMMEDLTQLAADALASALDVDCGPATDQGHVFAGLCVAFMPKSEGEPMPEELEGYDDAGEWS